jgi:hypothetical protein
MAVGLSLFVFASWAGKQASADTGSLSENARQIGFVGGAMLVFGLLQLIARASDQHAGVGGQHRERATPAPPPPPPPGSAWEEWPAAPVERPALPPPASRGAWGFVGDRFALEYQRQWVRSRYAIHDLWTDEELEHFPATPEGWRAAWTSFVAREPDPEPLQGGEAR